MTHPQYRKTDLLRCPGCGKEGVLQGHGFRVKTRRVLQWDGQQRVFSQGMTHIKCPAHPEKKGEQWGVFMLLLQQPFSPVSMCCLQWVDATVYCAAASCGCGFM